MNNNVTLKDIGGYDYPKKEVKKIIDFFKHYKEYTSQGAKLTTGLCLYGPCGTGKSMFAKAIVNETKAHAVWFQDDSSDTRELNIISSIKNAFKEAEQNTPSILVIDEIDQIVSCDERYGNKPSDKQRDALRVLLTEIDRTLDKDIFIIITANVDISLIPAPLVRNGRVEKHIHMNIPDQEDREAILKLYLNRNEVFSEIDPYEVAVMSSGLSCSALTGLVNDVLVSALTTHKKKVTLKNFIEPLQVITNNGIKNKDKKRTDHVIYHELGHLFMDYYLNKKTGMVSIQSYGKSEGSYRRFISARNAAKQINENEVLTYDDMFNEGCVCMAGLAATEVFLGTKYIGASNDLSKLLSYYDVLLENGIGNSDEISTFLVNTGSYGSSYADYNQSYTRGFSKFLNDVYEKCVTVLKANKRIVELLFKELKEKTLLTNEDVKKLLEDNKELINK